MILHKNNNNNHGVFLELLVSVKKFYCKTPTVTVVEISGISGELMAQRWESQSMAWGKLIFPSQICKTWAESR